MQFITTDVKKIQTQKVVWSLFHPCWMKYLTFLESSVNIFKFQLQGKNKFHPHSQYKVQGKKESLSFRPKIIILWVKSYRKKKLWQSHKCFIFLFEVYPCGLQDNWLYWEMVGIFHPLNVFICSCTFLLKNYFSIYPLKYLSSDVLKMSILSMVHSIDVLSNRKEKENKRSLYQASSAYKSLCCF